MGIGRRNIGYGDTCDSNYFSSLPVIYFHRAIMLRFLFRTNEIPEQNEKRSLYIVSALRGCCTPGPYF